MKPKWIVRIVLGVVLGALVVLGLLDYKAKTAAQDTADAWFDQIEQNVQKADLKPLIKGNPEVTTEADSPESDKRTEIYTWAGILRDYRVEVHLIGRASLGDKQLVSKIEGPLQD